MYQSRREQNGLKFQPLNITVKQWRKPKTSLQHRAYWKLISQIKDELRNLGYTYNEEQVHQFIKTESGFTEMVEIGDKQVMVTRSIANVSDDADIENLNYLISFMQQWAAEHLGLNLEII